MPVVAKERAKDIVAVVSESVVPLCDQEIVGLNPEVSMILADKVTL